MHDDGSILTILCTFMKSMGDAAKQPGQSAVSSGNLRSFLPAIK